jgi:hypothetical protein
MHPAEISQACCENSVNHLRSESCVGIQAIKAGYRNATGNDKQLN